LQVISNPERSERRGLGSRKKLRDRQTRRQRFTSGVAIVLGGLVLIASVVAPLSQLRSLHEILWWWGLGDQHPWLTWTIRGLSI
jgi:hypothetical protein